MKGEKKEKITWGDVFPKSRISIIDNGRMKKIRIEGAKKLLLCIEKEVKILLADEVLRAEGEGLSCTSYASGAIEIAGEITCLFFDSKRQRKEGNV